MITLTDTAAVKVRELLDAEGEPEMALRVAVRPGVVRGVPGSPPPSSAGAKGYVNRPEDQPFGVRRRPDGRV